MDTTLRDGEQTQGVSFTAEEKVSIAKALLEAIKVDRIEVASARVSEGEKDAVTSITQWAKEQGYEGRVEVLGFVDKNKSVDWICSAGGKVINLLAKGSEKHCREQLGLSLEEHAQGIRETVAYAVEKGLRVNIYLEDWSNGYYDKRDYVLALMQEIGDCGIANFMLPDTLGVMSPEEVFSAMSDMLQKFPRQVFDFHPHNDYGLATANVMAAVRAGVNNIHCTVNCLGERAGNVSMAEVAVVLKDKMNLQVSIDEGHIADISRMVASFSGKWVAANMPVVGEDVFTQTAGIHADGDLKGGLYVTDLCPERFARIRSYALGKLSGKASLQKNLQALGVELSAENQQRVLQRIIQLGDSKELITPADLPFIIADVLESGDFQPIELLNCYISSGLDVESTASIRLKIEDQVFSSSGSGNGGFDAFMQAIKSILQKQLISLPELVDFEVRIPRGGKTGALTECTITWELEQQKIKTRAVHCNQVLAAVQATLRVLNIILRNKLNLETANS